MLSCDRRLPASFLGDLMLSCVSSCRYYWCSGCKCFLYDYETEYNLTIIITMMDITLAYETEFCFATVAKLWKSKSLSDKIYDYAYRTEYLSFVFHWSALISFSFNHQYFLPIYDQHYSFNLQFSVCSNVDLSLSSRFYEDFFYVLLCKYVRKLSGNNCNRFCSFCSL
jgi:hypothetical protein